MTNTALLAIVFPLISIDYNYCDLILRVFGNQNPTRVAADAVSWIVAFTPIGPCKNFIL